MMKTLVLNDDDVPYHRLWDVREMSEALADIGYRIMPKDLFTAWDRYSDSMAAGWMTPPKDGWAIFYAIQAQVLEEE